MKTLVSRTLACLGAAILLTSTSQVSAQEAGRRGNFDPEQMRQRMMERYREQLEITKDDEWKIVQERVDKVMAARRDVGFGGMGGMAGFGRGGRGGEDRNAQAPAAGNDDNARRGRGGSSAMFGGEPSPEAEALQKAIESKASAEDLKAKLAKLREARKTKEANLEKAQQSLREVLTVRQEAAAVLMGLLK